MSNVLYPDWPQHRDPEIVGMLNLIEIGYEQGLQRRISASQARVERLRTDGDIIGMDDEISYRNGLMDDLNAFHANLKSVGIK